MPKVAPVSCDAPKFEAMAEQELAALEAQKKSLDTLFAEAQKARYKIELTLSGDRRRIQAVAGLLVFWESGAMLHGGGDGALYICPGKHLKRNDCAAFMNGDCQALGTWICPKCQTQWKPADVIGQLGFRLTMQNWAVVLHRYYIALGGNADLVMSYMPDTIRGVAEREQQKQLGGDLLGRVRGRRTKVVYPLANIIKDTSAGAGLYNRIYAFLRES
jgi:hypothetical protein